jgi:hypothetical protein
LYDHWVPELVVIQTSEPDVVFTWNEPEVEKYLEYVIWPTKDAAAAVVDCVDVVEPASIAVLAAPVAASGGVEPDCPLQPVAKNVTPSTPKRAKARTECIKPPIV